MLVRCAFWYYDNTVVRKSPLFLRTSTRLSYDLDSGHVSSKRVVLRVVQ